MSHFRCAVMLLLPAGLLAGVTIAADPPAKTAPGQPKVGDRLAAFNPTNKLNAAGARKCETC